MESNVSSTDNGQVTKKWGIAGSTLKLVAIFSMLIDHTAATILERMLARENYNDEFLYQIYSIMRYIGRLAFPIFCFLLLEGMVHTHNKYKYAIRLAIFALISEIPFDLAFNNKLIYTGSQNVFFTLLIGLLVMIGFETLKDKWNNKKWLPVLAVLGAITASFIYVPIIKSVVLFINDLAVQFGVNLSLNMNDREFLILPVISAVILILVYVFLCKEKSFQAASLMFADLAVLAAGMLLAKALCTDYDSFGVLTIAIMYGLRGNYMNSMLGGCISLTTMYIGEFTSFLDLFLINFYNGKRGINLKYVFYGFYPVHLLLLYFICYFMKLV